MPSWPPSGTVVALCRPPPCPPPACPPCLCAGCWPAQLVLLFSGEGSTGSSKQQQWQQQVHTMAGALGRGRKAGAEGRPEQERSRTESDSLGRSNLTHPSPLASSPSPRFPQAPPASPEGFAQLCYPPPPPPTFRSQRKLRPSLLQPWTDGQGSKCPWGRPGASTRTRVHEVTEN